MKLQNPQLKGGHYAPIHGISPDMIVTPLPFWLGSALKYVWRAPRKNGGEDFLKAADCLRRYANQLVNGAPQELPYWGVVSKSETLQEKLSNHSSVHALAVNSVLSIVLWGSSKSFIHELHEKEEGSKEKAFIAGASYVLRLHNRAEMLECWAQKIGDEDQKTIWELVNQK